MLDAARTTFLVHLVLSYQYDLEVADLLSAGCCEYSGFQSGRDNSGGEVPTASQLTGFSFIRRP